MQSQYEHMSQHSVSHFMLPVEKYQSALWCVVDSPVVLWQSLGEGEVGGGRGCKTVVCVRCEIVCDGVILDASAAVLLRKCTLRIEQLGLSDDSSFT